MYMHELPFLVVVIYMQAVQNAAFPLQTCPALPLAVCVCVCVALAAAASRDLCEVPFRDTLKPLDIVQPEGASWTVS
jgi:peptidoglycan/LPS O-acetylase OafA/YrhL